jgi:hypothetical protein
MATRQIAIRLSVEQAAEVRAALKAVGDQGKASLELLSQAAAQSNAATEKAGQGFQSLRGTLGGLGLQLQDVAVQAQSGTAALTILGQQGPQIASLFGPAGAIVGAGVVMAAFAAQLVTAAANGKQLSDVFKEIDQSSKLVEAAAEARMKGLENEVARVNTLTSAYRNFSAAALQGERARLTIEQTELQRSGRSAVSGIDATAFGMIGGSFSRTGYLMSGQGAAQSAEETAALSQLQGLQDVASITYERVAEVYGALDRAAKASGPFASEMGTVRDRLREQTAALVELGNKARENASAAGIVDRMLNGTAVGVVGGDQFGPPVADASSRAAARRAEAEARREQAAAIRDENALQREAAQIIADLQTPTERYAETLTVLREHLEAGRITQEQFNKAAAAWDPATKAAADAARKAQQAVEQATKQQIREAERTYDRIVDYGGNAFADLFLDTEGSWKKTMQSLERTAIATFAKIAFEAATRPIIMPIIQQFTGASGAGLAATAAGMAGSGTNGGAGSGGSVLGYAGQAGQAYSLFNNGGSLNPGTYMSGQYNWAGNSIISGIDSTFQTGIGTWLNTPVNSSTGVATAATVADPLGTGVIGTGEAVGSTAGTAAGTAGMAYGSYAAAGLGVAAGAYGVYKGLERGGPGGYTSAAGSAALGGMSAYAAIAGSMAAVPVYGWIAAAALMVLGSLLPGQKPSNREGNAYVDVGTGTITPGGQTGEKYSEDNVRAATDTAEALKQYTNQLSKYGIRPIGQFSVGFGDRDGMYAQFGDDRREFGRDEAGAKEAMEFIGRSLIELNAQQLSGNLRTTYERVGTADLERLLGALDWTKDVYEPLVASKDQASAYAQQLKALAAQFDPIIAKAQEYGLALEPIQTMYAEQIATLNKTRDLQLNSLRLGIDMELAQLRGGTGSEAWAAISRLQFNAQAETRRQQVEQQFKDLGASAEEVAIRLGILAQVTDEQRAAMEEGIVTAREAEQRTQLTSRYEGLAFLSERGGILQSFLDQQAVNDASPQTAFLAAQSQYERAMASARGAGQIDADLGAVTNAARTLIDTSSAFYGDGAQGAAIRSQITSQIRSLGVDLQLGGFADLDTSLRTYTDATRDGTAAINRLTIQVERLEDELRTLRLRNAA